MEHLLQKGLLTLKFIMALKRAGGFRSSLFWSSPHVVGPLRPGELKGHVGFLPGAVQGFWLQMWDLLLCPALPLSASLLLRLLHHCLRTLLPWGPHSILLTVQWVFKVEILFLITQDYTLHWEGRGYWVVMSLSPFFRHHTQKIPDENVKHVVCAQFQFTMLSFSPCYVVH